jgi:cell division protein FtsB
LEEYFRLLRSQIKDGKLKERTHLDSLGVLNERIADLEKEQVTLQSTNMRDKRTIKDLEDGNPLLLHF